jgi:hypothetical protein
MDEISQASIDNQALMHRLIKAQRNTSKAGGSMVLSGQLTSDINNIREGWADYYEKLGKAQETHDPDELLS